MKTTEEAAAEIKNRRKKRIIKVAITEGLMAVAVLALVVVMTLFAVGYNVNPQEGTVEKTGLVQIQSLPTGANVVLDGNSLFGWTNLSQSMSEGEHTIIISKDGYDTWSKQILVTAGLYYRLNYPRLFLSEKKTEVIADFSAIKLTSFAKDGNTMLAVPAESTTWQLWKINNDKPTKTELKLAEAFPALSEEVLKGELEIKGWSGNSEKILLTLNDQWLLLDIKHPADSINLTEKFGIAISDAKIANDAASELFILENGNLRTINIDGDKISGVLVSKVINFDNLKTDAVFETYDEATGEFKTGIYRMGEKGGTILSEMQKNDLADEVKVLVAIGEYYGEYYIIEAVNDQIGVYKGNKLPSFSDDQTQIDDNFSAILVKEIGFTPEELEVTGGGGLYTAVKGSECAVFDVETLSVRAWQLEVRTDWLDEHMVYGVVENELVVADFDGENQRVLVDSVASNSPAKIAKNNKWLYYLDQNSNLARLTISK